MKNKNISKFQAMKRYLLLSIIMLATFSGWSQGLVTEGTKIVDQYGEQVILRGMGFGGWMVLEGYMMHSSDVADTQHEFRDRLIDLMGEDNTNEFFDAWLDNHVTKADIDSLASWGYNSCRLPMHYNLFTLPIEEEPVPGENTWLDKGFNMVDSLLLWCESNNIYLILDLHAAPGGQGYNAAICDYDPSKPSLWESQENRDKTVALWTKLAERYADEPWMGGYDLLNEVNWNLPGNTMLRELYEEITEAIRVVDTSHMIIIEGNWFANDFTGLTPPWDDNMVYSFHKYWNYNDQGSVDWVLTIPEQYNVPLWMGEGGENSNVWFHDAIAILEENEIGWSFWPMKRIETIVGQYSILFTDGYKAVLDYWRGQGPQPTVTEAYDAMMELAINTNSANCLYRKDVHDAQVRQVATDETIPYSYHTIPGIVHMSDFDLGKLNHSYYDVDNASYSLSTGEFTAWNSGWHYRNDGVDVEPNDDDINSNGFHIGYVNEGEWTNYTVEISASAAYTARARIASEQTGGKLHLAFDGEDITATQSVTGSGSWFEFADLEIEDVVLTEGEHVITLWIDGSTPFNISSIEFTESGSIEEINVMAVNGHTGENEKSIEVAVNQPILQESINGSLDNFTVTVNGEVRTIASVSFDSLKERTILLNFEDYLVHTDDILVSYDGSVITSQSGKTLEAFTDLEIRNTLPERAILPQKIQAEDFIYMIGLGIEETTDLGGGHNIGYTNPGDYADYLIFGTDENIYRINIRLAAQNATGSFGFYLIDEEQVETELCIVETPVTGGWQNWETEAAYVSIPQGAYTLRMRVIAGEFNMNWFEFVIVDGIEDESNGIKSGFNIYPNPVYDNKLFIDFETVEKKSFPINLYSITGKQIFSGIYPLKNGRIEMDISGIPGGIYLLEVFTDNKTFNYKVIRY